MEPLLEIVERHLKRAGVAPTRFGREAAHDPRLVFDMRRGRRPRADVRQRILKAIETAGETTCGT